MKITLLAIGHKMPAWVSETFAQYNSRLPAHQQLHLKEIQPIIRNKSLTRDQVKLKEAQLLKKYFRQGDYNIALDEKGKLISTKYLVSQINDWQQTGHNVNVIIGGADGLDSSILTTVHAKWSLSHLTFPHQLVRVIVAEQFYRAYSVINGHPYHRE